jgi:hypothetical protein
LRRSPRFVGRPLDMPLLGATVNRRLQGTSSHNRYFAPLLKKTPPSLFSKSKHSSSTCGGTRRDSWVSIPHPTSLCSEPSNRKIMFIGDANSCAIVQSCVVSCMFAVLRFGCLALLPRVSRESHPASEGRVSSPASGWGLQSREIRQGGFDELTVRLNFHAISAGFSDSGA